jgi:hypothetical protein
MPTIPAGLYLADWQVIRKSQQLERGWSHGFRSHLHALEVVLGSVVLGSVAGSAPLQTPGCVCAPSSLKCRSSAPLLTPGSQHAVFRFLSRFVHVAWLLSIAISVWHAICQWMLPFRPAASDRRNNLQCRGTRNCGSIYSANL